MIRFKRFFAALFASAIFTALFAAAPITASAHSYPDDWHLWEQKQSSYSSVVNSGCRITAQAKLLAEAGILEEGTNPDDYFNWMKKNGWITGTISETWGNGGKFNTGTGSAVLDYADKHGAEIQRVVYSKSQVYFDLSGLSAEERVAKVWEFIQNGYYVILDCNSGTTHQTYVARDLSLEAGKPIISESYHSTGVPTCYEYLGYVHGSEVKYTKAYVYEVVTHPLSEFVSVEAEVTFLAAADAELTATLHYESNFADSVKEIGLYVGTEDYDLYHRIARRVNAEGFENGESVAVGLQDNHVVLSPLTTYYFVFYAMSEANTSDGEKIVYSDIYSFTTPNVFFTLRYDANGGFGAPQEQEKEKTVPLALRQELPEREGYLFLGWAMEENGEETYQPGDEFTEEKSATLYAVWLLIGDLDGSGELDTADAIYILYHTFFGEEQYPVSQACDYDGDGGVTASDAIYLLYHTFYPEEYPLNPLAQ